MSHNNSISTLFVLPLDQKYVCPLHKGILEDPVTDAKGISVCRACLLLAHDENTSVATNQPLQDEIDSLLCYCSNGVTMNTNGQLIPIPNNKGCSHIVKYGSRLQHEATCEFNDKDFVVMRRNSLNEDNTNSSLAKEASPNTPLNVAPSSVSDAAILEMRKSLEARDMRIAMLEQELFLRDKEIYTLREQLQQEREHPAAVFARRTVDGTKGLLDDVMKVIVNDIPNGIKQAQAAFAQSQGFQKASAFKDQVAAKAQSVGQQASEVHPIDKLISALVELRNELVKHVKYIVDTTRGEFLLLGNNITNTNTNNNNNNNNNMTNGNNTNNDNKDTTTAAQPLATPQDDAELLASLKISMTSFEEEEHARQVLARAEQAAMAAATMASLHVK